MKGHIARVQKAREDEQNESQTIREFIQRVLMEPREEGPFDVDNETHSKIFNALLVDFLFSFFLFSLVYLMVALILTELGGFRIWIVMLPYAVFSYYFYRNTLVWGTQRLRIKHD